MMAVPQPVRRGAGVVNCKSMPFDHIVIRKNRGGHFEGGAER